MSVRQTKRDRERVTGDCKHAFLRLVVELARQRTNQQCVAHTHAQHHTLHHLFTAALMLNTYASSKIS